MTGGEQELTLFDVAVIVGVVGLLCVAFVAAAERILERRSSDEEPEQEAEPLPAFRFRLYNGDGRPEERPPEREKATSERRFRREDRTR